MKILHYKTKTYFVLLYRLKIYQLNKTLCFQE